MTKVILDVSLSLDGFSAGSNVDVAQPMGKDGERLHDWLSSTATEADSHVASELFSSAGAVVTGRRTFDVGIDRWGDDGAFGMPVFVLTHRDTPRLKKGPTTFTFVTDGIASSFEQAKSAARGKNIWLMGAADVAQQYLKAGLVDELLIHLAPVVLGAGKRFFESGLDQPLALERIRTIESASATHLTYRVIK
jgi:dihydrofolate reductase